MTNDERATAPAAIEKDELLTAVQQQRVQVVNVLPHPESVIAGARTIPTDELESRLGELDRGKDVVVYCLNRACKASDRAARILAGRGFHVRRYLGGIQEWEAENLPTEPGGTSGDPTT